MGGPDRWYCFYCREWHDRGTTCYLNKEHYGIGDYDEFWRFIEEHGDALEEALSMRDKRSRCI